MALATNLGFSRIGAKRELKKATESYWKGDISQADLLAAGKAIRAAHWQMQKDAGLDHVPCNDFSFYDIMLDMSALLGAVPARYEWAGGTVDLDTYFAMARGNDKAPAMEMTKWFDTNYHYIVPELDRTQTFKISATKIFDEFAEAKAAGIPARPVLIGPVTYLSLSKTKDESDALDLLSQLLPVYAEILGKLKAAGAQWVQIDEPVLALDLTNKQREGLMAAYSAFAPLGLKILVASYFGDLRDNLDLALSLPVAALHIDLRRGPNQLSAVLDKVPTSLSLSLGIVDGRNVWKNNLRNSLTLLRTATEKLGPDRVFVAPSCSMMHCPIDLDLETRMDPQLKSWMAFGKQKLNEISLLAKALKDGDEAIADALAESDAVANDRATSPRSHDPIVRARMESMTTDMLSRKSPFAHRRTMQHAALDLPMFPTTTIGSFPQTKEIREARANLKKGLLTPAAYDEMMKKEIAAVVQFQEQIGIDVLVHGEPERNDMVEYFGEQLQGYTFSQNGWVQSYGSRYVKPPIIFGDVSRPKAMTVEWSKYAQSLTEHPMKGMLTGPVTMLFWSFVRDDQPKSETCFQIAFAIRDEVVDLEDAGIKVIQIDEPAIREGLPLRKADWNHYLSWAVDSFRLSASGVLDATQIHTHMCYSEFNDIIESIGEMDADVISIETSRSQMELLEAFVAYKYPNEIGPGVYDIHSPRIPSMEDIVILLEKAATVLSPEQIWVNPDCGLKTRHWNEVRPSLQHMVAAAKIMRGRMGHHGHNDAAE
jgi:5-methyltetrahydropteroyltriglutamate--homocysteine methyltransferase